MIENARYQTVSSKLADSLYEQALNDQLALFYQTSGDLDCPKQWYAITSLDGVWYLVKHDTFGFSYAYACRDEEQAQEAFDALDEAYGAWLREELTS